MKAEIIAVGTELLLGDIVNTNAAFLSRELAALGFDLYYQGVVGDNANRLSHAVELALGRSQLVVLCGGLGPTADDLTKETVAEVIGQRLVPDQKAAQLIEQYFLCRNKHKTNNNNKQALVFENGTVLYNDNGTAPGLFCQTETGAVLLLPGPPHELIPMFNDKARPILEGLTGSTIHSKTLHIIGIGESELEVKLGGLPDGQNPTVALYAKTGEIHLRITAKAQSSEQAKALVEQKQKEVESIVGDMIYSDDGKDLAETVVSMLSQKGLTLALSESITGGGVAAAITSVPGASSVFSTGIVSYNDNAKTKLLNVSEDTLSRHTAVSPQTAIQMAEGVRTLSGSYIGASVTGYAGPTGEQVGLVYCAVATAEGTLVEKFDFGNMRSRAYIRELAVKNLLNMIRKTLQNT